MAGYYNYSKSNNAIAAERAGIYPATKAAKIYGFKSAAALKSLVKSREWHHSSKFYNCVDYYDVSSEIQDIESLSNIDNWLPKMRKSGRDMILDKAAQILKDNLDMTKNAHFDIIRLRNAAGYYKDRKRNIKR